VRVSAEVDHPGDAAKRPLQIRPLADPAKLGLGAEGRQVVERVRGHPLEEEAHVVGEVVHFRLQLALLDTERQNLKNYETVER